MSSDARGALFQANVLEGVPDIADESVDVCVTSPPYFQRDGAGVDLWLALGRLLGRVLRPGARAFVVVGAVAENPALASEVLSTTLEGSSDASKPKSSWLFPCQTIAWVKSVAVDGVTRGHFQPIGGADRLLNYCWESVLHFVKGAPGSAPPLDRLAVGVPYADKGNLARGNRGKNGDLHCAGDCWFVPYETTGASKKKGHRHAFPIELARRLIRVSGVPRNSTVLDPFVGGGTVPCAARQLGMRYVAADQDADALDATLLSWEHAGDAVPVDPPRRGTNVLHKGASMGFSLVAENLAILRALTLRPGGPFLIDSGE